MMTLDEFSPTGIYEYDSSKMPKRIDLSLLAIKKQIPVKVDTTASCWRCPVCGMELHGTRYCPDCGQALDWGNDE